MESEELGRESLALDAAYCATAGLVLGDASRSGSGGDRRRRFGGVQVFALGRPAI